MSFKVDMNAATLELLAADRREHTVEAFTPNDFYGHATVLKKYCGLPNDHVIQGVLPHGPCISSKIWEVEKNHPFKARFLLSETQRNVYQAQSDRSLYVIGSPMCYAAKMLGNELDSLRRSAQGTLVFPAHSTHHITATFDHQAFIERLKQIAPKEHPVTVCLYWRDIQLGRHRDYLEAGFQCTTAGHMFDPGFVERMLKIILSHKSALTNRIGSSSLFAAAFGLPVRFTNLEVEHKADQEQFQREVAPHDLPLVEPFIKAGLSNETDSGKIQRQLGKEAIGADVILSPNELKDLFQTVEAIQQGKPQFTFPSLSFDTEIPELLETLKDHSVAYPKNQRGTLGFRGRALQFFDLNTFRNEAQRIFIENTYEFKCNTRTPVIIDCGTNLGLLPLYYAEKYPDARIVAFEADPIKAKLAQDNFDSAHLSNIKLINKAVWLNSGTVPFLCQTDIGEPTVLQVPAVSLNEFIGTQTIDLLRLNLAGAEFHVIKESTDVLKNVRHLVAEVHQIPRQAPHLAELLCALRALDFQCHLHEHRQDQGAQEGAVKGVTLFAWRQLNVETPVRTGGNEQPLQASSITHPLPTHSPLPNAVSGGNPTKASQPRKPILQPC